MLCVTAVMCDGRLSTMLDWLPLLSEGLGWHKLRPAFNCVYDCHPFCGQVDSADHAVLLPLLAASLQATTMLRHMSHPLQCGLCVTQLRQELTTPPVYATQLA